MTRSRDRDGDDAGADATDAHAAQDARPTENIRPTDEADGVPGDVDGAASDDDPGWPWSFLLLVAAGAAYLIFRFVELGIKLFS